MGNLCSVIIQSFSKLVFLGTFNVKRDPDTKHRPLCSPMILSIGRSIPICYCYAKTDVNYIRRSVSQRSILLLRIKRNQSIPSATKQPCWWSVTAGHPEAKALCGCTSIRSWQTKSPLWYSVMNQHVRQTISEIFTGMTMWARSSVMLIAHIRFMVRSISFADTVYRLLPGRTDKIWTRMWKYTCTG